MLLHSLFFKFCVSKILLLGHHFSWLFSQLLIFTLFFASYNNNNNAFISIIYLQYIYIHIYHTLCRRTKELEHASFDIFVIFYKPISFDSKKVDLHFHFSYYNILIIMGPSVYFIESRSPSRHKWKFRI